MKKKMVEINNFRVDLKGGFLKKYMDNTVNILQYNEHPEMWTTQKLEHKLDAFWVVQVIERNVEVQRILEFVLYFFIESSYKCSPNSAIKQIRKPEEFSFILIWIHRY